MQLSDLNESHYKSMEPIKAIESQFRLMPACENGTNLGNSKELIQVRNLIAFKDGQFHDLASVRWFISWSNSPDRMWCTLWLPTKLFGEYRSGTGITSGYGFCKQSDAFERALNSAGVYPVEPVSGRGMSTVDDCLLAMAKHAGYEHAYIAKG